MSEKTPMTDHAKKLGEQIVHLREASKEIQAEGRDGHEWSESIADLFESLVPVVDAIASELSNFDNVHSCVPHIRKKNAQAFLAAVENLK